MSISYQHIKESTLRELLGDLEDEELEKWIEQNDWTRKDDDLIFVTNQEEIVKSKNIVDKVNFESKFKSFLKTLKLGLFEKLSLN